MLSLGCISPHSGKESTTPANRPELWVNVLRSEPAAFDEVIDELQSARVIYLGEYHSIPRHHELQRAILNGLAKRGVKLVLALEQFEFWAEPTLKRFNAKELDLDGLIAEADWTRQWKSHSNYHALVMDAQSHGIPLLGLNARAETIRAVGKQGLAQITHEQRAELPSEIVTDDLTYERLVTKLLGVHMAFDPQKLRPVFEAQVARDETMAAQLSGFLTSPAGQDRTAIVICGRGHCEFGLGMPDRVARRMPGVTQRIILFSQSGDLQLTDAEKRQSREIVVPHEFLREVGRFPADFLHVTEPATN